MYSKISILALLLASSSADTDVSLSQQLQNRVNKKRTGSASQDFSAAIAGKESIKCKVVGGACRSVIKVSGIVTTQALCVADDAAVVAACELVGLAYLLNSCCRVVAPEACLQEVTFPFISKINHGDVKQ